MLRVKAKNMNQQHIDQLFTQTVARAAKAREEFLASLARGTRSVLEALRESDRMAEEQGYIKSNNAWRHMTDQDELHRQLMAVDLDW